MTIPFSFAGVLNLQADPALPADPLPYSCTGAFGSETKQRLELVGSGTQVVSFGTAGSPGAKFISIAVDLPAEGDPPVAPVNARFNGGASTGQTEISAGGCAILCNPTPVAGATSLSLVYTTAAVVTVRILE
jgi:hypothetical protein